jgi:diguanylate cyclase (GGDEF)-like protein
VKDKNMAAEYSILYLEINIISFVLIAIILRKTSGLSRMVKQINFAMSIVAEMVFFASDTIYVLISNDVIHFGAYDNTAMLICKEVYFLSTSVMCYFWFIYFEHVRDSSFVKEQKNVRISSAFVWVMIIMLVVNVFTGFLFYVSEDGGYHRGPLFVLTYILPYIYVLIACIRTLKDLFDESYAGDKHALKLLVLFPLAPAVAGLLQFKYPRLPVACGVLAIATLIMYLNWIDQLISLDPLTGLNNRKQLDHFYDHWMKNHGETESIYLMMIDADKFKSINDTYGHVQGDKALKNIAEALRQGCLILPKRANIARYGGDEFAVMFETNDTEDINRLKTAIREKLDVINERAQIPYTLTISIGVAPSDGTTSLKQLVNKADEAMYEEKALRK